jgi:hypothetical protein
MAAMIRMINSCEVLIGNSFAPAAYHTTGATRRNITTRRVILKVSGSPAAEELEEEKRPGFVSRRLRKDNYIRRR